MRIGIFHPETEAVTRFLHPGRIPRMHSKAVAGQLEERTDCSYLTTGGGAARTLSMRASQA
jgi:hypothetical protein